MRGFCLAIVWSTDCIVYDEDSMLHTVYTRTKLYFMLLTNRYEHVRYSRIRNDT